MTVAQMEEISLPYTINLPLPELSRERNYIPKHNYVVLADGYMEVRAQYKSEIENENTKVWESSLSFYHMKIKKSSISYLGYRYFRKPDVFGIEIESIGMADTLYFYFKDKIEGQKVFEIIDNWIYKI